MDSPVDADLVVVFRNPEMQQHLDMLWSQAFLTELLCKEFLRRRTFIKPKQSSRESAVRIKLNVLKEAVAGKRVIMIDDSIVRGTTSALIVGMLRDAGAKEVHVRISAPPFLHPCYFGTDIPSEDQLIAHNRTVEEIRDLLGADSLSYLEMDRLYEMAGEKPICTACFSGDYPIDRQKRNTPTAAMISRWLFR